MNADNWEYVLAYWEILDMMTPCNDRQRDDKIDDISCGTVLSS